MSRAMNVKLKLDDVVERCAKAKVPISAIEPLPSGHTHLVCVTSDGAETMRKALGSHLMEGRQPRYAFMSVRASK
jgi:hypothetical protein